MEYLYVSCFPDQYFETMQKVSIKSISQPSQKFNYLIARGIKLNNEKVTVLNIIDYLAIEEGDNYSGVKTIEEGGIEYKFLPVFGFCSNYRKKIKKNIEGFLMEWARIHKESVIIVDVLKPFSYYLFGVARRLKIPTISIVTDLPEHIYFASSLKSRVRRTVKIKEFQRMIKLSSGYIFLTDKMNYRLNKKHKEYQVIEGVSDIEANLMIEANEVSNNICLYAGALHARYGIKNMIDAFASEELRGIELHLYGDGDCVEYIKECSKMHNNIKYFGVVDNKTVVQRQKKASVLLNPRPIDEEFTEYSFPSKNMEYMTSGTPLLTTRLPGMSKEYLDYVYILDASNVVNIISSIKSFFEIDISERRERGKEAQKFIREIKNNKIQAKRIIDMANKLYK